MKQVTLWDYAGRFAAICLFFIGWYLIELVYSWVKILFEKPWKDPRQKGA